MPLENVAEELYGLPPEEFIAARKLREAQARADGDRALAAEIAALGKPSTAAWVCNLLAREQPEEIAGLVELGGLLREAQENLAGDQLRALDVQRRQLVAALTRQARGLAYGRGHPVTTTVATQVEETLRAAMADPEAGEVLVAGRLTTALSYSGLGTGQRPDLRVVAPARPARPARPEPAPARKGTRAARDSDDDAARRRERDRAEAERRAAEERRRRDLEEAAAADEEAAAAAEQAAAAERAETATVDRLRDREAALGARIEELTDELDRARNECTQVRHDLSRAERRQTAAARRAADAAQAHERASRHLQDLRRR